MMQRKNYDKLMFYMYFSQVRHAGTCCQHGNNRARLAKAFHSTKWLMIHKCSFNQMVDHSAKLGQMCAMDSSTDPTLDAVFAALADPTRRALVTRLLDADQTVSALAEPFDMSLAAISKHLGILTSAGLVSQRREGRVKWCRLEIDSLQPAAMWMEVFGAAGADSFDALEQHITALGLVDPE